MTLTEDLVHLIRDRSVESEDLAQAALFALDTVANVLAGRRTEPGKILRCWAAERPVLEMVSGSWCEARTAGAVGRTAALSAIRR